MPTIYHNFDPVGYLIDYGGLDNIVITDIVLESGYIPRRYFNSYDEIPVYEGLRKAKGRLFFRMPNPDRKKRGTMYRFYFRVKD